MRFTRRRAMQGAVASMLTYQVVGSIGSAKAQAEVGADAGGETAMPADPVFGVSGDFALLARRSPDQLSELLATVAGAGATVARFPVDWSALQSKLGEFEWGLLEPLYSELMWNGMKAIPVIVNTDSNGLDRFNNDDTGITDIQDPLQSLTLALSGFFSRYGPQLGGIEVWSEPNGPDPETALKSRDLQHAVGSVAEVGVGLGDDAGAPAIAGGLAIDEAGTWARFLPRLASLGDAVEVALHIPPPESLDDASLGSYFMGPIDEASSAGIGRVWVCTAVPAGATDQDIDDLVGGWGQLVAHPNCAGFLVHTDLHDEDLSASFDACLTGGERMSPDSPALAAAQTVWGT